MDSFQKNGVVENDYQFTCIHAIREKCKKGEDRCEVEIWELE
jgi:Holliday junction resolvase RusA-like endonuclease